MNEPGQFTRHYTCDPAKNKECSKRNCYINGGPCKLTKIPEYALNFDKVTLIGAVDPKDFEDIVKGEDTQMSIVAGLGDNPNRAQRRAAMKRRSKK